MHFHFWVNFSSNSLFISHFTQLGSCCPLKMSWHGGGTLWILNLIFTRLFKVCSSESVTFGFFFVALSSNICEKNMCFYNNVPCCTICCSQKKNSKPTSLFSWHFWISVCVHNAKSIENNCTVGSVGRQKHMKLQCLYSPWLVFSAKSWFISQKPHIAKCD